jgi:hypothetical protein
LATTIQVSEETQAKLIQLTAELQAKLGRRVSYDEAIAILIERSRGAEEAKDRFHKLFGSLRGDKEAWKNLRQLRQEDERLERLGRAS